MCIKPYFHLKTRYFKIKIGKQIEEDTELATGDEYQKEKAYFSWLWPCPSVLPRSRWVPGWRTGASSCSWVTVGAERGTFPTENLWTPFLSCSSGDVCVCQVSLGNQYNFLWASAAFPCALFVKLLPSVILAAASPWGQHALHLIAWLGINRRKCFAGGSEWHAASDFSCQLIRICWVRTRSNEIRKKMQCVWYAFPITVSFM